MRLLKEIQAETGTAIIFITHDFGIVARMCDRVAVMYAGKIVEQADVVQLFDSPAHPYTEALLASVPDLNVDVDLLPSMKASHRPRKTCHRAAPSRRGAPTFSTSVRNTQTSSLWNQTTLPVLRRRPC